MTSSFKISSVLSWWRGLSPMTRGLVWFTLLVAIVLPLFLTVATGGRTSLHHLRHVLIWDLHEDSWAPMKMAIDLNDANPGEPIYTDLFFQEQIRFQYPPVSLFLVKPLYKLRHVTHDPYFWQNLMCVIAFVANIVVIVMIFFRVLDARRAGQPPLARLERLVLGAAVTVLTITFAPLVASVDVGQIQAVIDLLFALAVLAMIDQRQRIAGVLVGLTCAFKPQLGLLVIWGGLRREWRFAATLLAVGVALVAISLLVFGLNQNIDFLRALNYLSSHGESSWWNQSVMALIHRLLHNGANTEEEFVEAMLNGTEFLPPYNIWAHAGSLISSVLLIALALFFRPREHARAPLVDFLIAALTFTMASPVAWAYHFGIVPPIFAVALPMILTAGSPRRMPLVLLGIAFILLGERFDVTQRFAASYLNVLESFMLFGGLLLLWCLYELRHAEAHAQDRREVPAMHAAAVTEQSRL